MTSSSFISQLTGFHEMFFFFSSNRAWRCHFPNPFIFENVYMFSLHVSNHLSGGYSVGRENQRPVWFLSGGNLTFTFSSPGAHRILYLFLKSGQFTRIWLFCSNFSCDIVCPFNEQIQVFFYFSFLLLYLCIFSFFGPICSVLFLGEHQVWVCYPFFVCLPDLLFSL